MAALSMTPLAMSAAPEVESVTFAQSGAVAASHYRASLNPLGAVHLATKSPSSLRSPENSTRGGRARRENGRMSPASAVHGDAMAKIREAAAAAARAEEAAAVAARAANSAALLALEAVTATHDDEARAPQLTAAVDGSQPETRKRSWTEAICACFTPSVREEEGGGDGGRARGQRAQEQRQAMVFSPLYHGTPYKAPASRAAEDSEAEADSLSPGSRGLWQMRETSPGLSNEVFYKAKQEEGWYSSEAVKAMVAAYEMGKQAGARDSEAASESNPGARTPAPPAKMATREWVQQLALSEEPASVAAESSPPPAPAQPPLRAPEKNPEMRASLAGETSTEQGPQEQVQHQTWTPEPGPECTPELAQLSNARVLSEPGASEAYSTPPDHGKQLFSHPVHPTPEPHDLFEDTQDVFSALNTGSDLSAPLPPVHIDSWSPPRFLTSHAEAAVVTQALANPSDPPAAAEIGTRGVAGEGGEGGARAGAVYSGLRAMGSAASQIWSMAVAPMGQWQSQSPSPNPPPDGGWGSQSGAGEETRTAEATAPSTQSKVMGSPQAITSEDLLLAAMSPDKKNLVPAISASSLLPESIRKRNEARLKKTYGATVPTLEELLHQVRTDQAQPAQARWEEEQGAHPTAIRTPAAAGPRPSQSKTVEKLQAALLAEDSIPGGRVESAPGRPSVSLAARPARTKVAPRYLQPTASTRVRELATAKPEPGKRPDKQDSVSGTAGRSTAAQMTLRASPAAASPRDVEASKDVDSLPTRAGFAVSEARKAVQSKQLPGNNFADGPQTQLAPQGSVIDLVSGGGVGAEASISGQVAAAGQSSGASAPASLADLFNDVRSDLGVLVGGELPPTPKGALDTEEHFWQGQGAHQVGALARAFSELKEDVSSIVGATAKAEGTPADAAAQEIAKGLPASPDIGSYGAQVLFDTPREDLDGIRSVAVNLSKTPEFDPHQPDGRDAGQSQEAPQLPHMPVLPQRRRKKSPHSATKTRPRGESESPSLQKVEVCDLRPRPALPRPPGMTPLNISRVYEMMELENARNPAAQLPPVAPAPANKSSRVETNAWAAPRPSKPHPGQSIARLDLSKLASGSSKNLSAALASHKSSAKSSSRSALWVAMADASWRAGGTAEASAQRAPTHSMPSHENVPATAAPACESPKASLLESGPSFFPDPSSSSRSSSNLSAPREVPHAPMWSSGDNLITLEFGGAEGWTGSQWEGSQRELLMATARSNVSSPSQSAPASARGHSHALQSSFKASSPPRSLDAKQHTSTVDAHKFQGLVPGVGCVAHDDAWLPPLPPPPPASQYASTPPPRAPPQPAYFLPHGSPSTPPLPPRPTAKHGGSTPNTPPSLLQSFKSRFVSSMGEGHWRALSGKSTAASPASVVKNPLATPPAKGTTQSPAFASHPLDERSAQWSDDFDTEDEYELLPVEAAEHFVAPSNNRPASGNSAESPKYVSRVVYETGTHALDSLSVHNDSASAVGYDPGPLSTWTPPGSRTASVVSTSFRPTKNPLLGMVAAPQINSQSNNVYTEDDAYEYNIGDDGNILVDDS